MTPKKPFKVRRITPNGPIGIRSREKRPGPSKERLYARRDADGSGLRIQVQRFGDEIIGQLVRGENDLLEWAFRREPFPAPDAPLAAVGLEEIPVLSEKLRSAGFQPDREVWPPEFTLILEALAPIIQSVLAEYAGFRLRAETRCALWRSVANGVWGALGEGSELKSTDDWRKTISESASMLIRHAGRFSRETDDAPRTPGEWYAHGAEWTARVRAACAPYHLSFPRQIMVENVCSDMFGWLDFVIRRPARSGQDAPMSLGEFEDEAFFPALEAALAGAFGDARRRKTKSPFRARPEYAFQKELFEETRTRFNRLRTHWRGTKRYAGRKAGNPIDDTENLAEAVEVVTSRLGSIDAKKTRSIKTLILFIKIRKSLPGDLGRREVRSVVYKRLAKKYGVPVGTIRKRIHDAMKLLRKYLETGRRIARKGNDLASACERANAARECKPTRTINARRGARHEPPRRPLSRREAAADRPDIGTGDPGDL